MSWLLKAMVKKGSLSAASNISFIYLTNIYSALTLSRHPAGLWDFSDDQSPTLCGVYNLEVETGINETITEIIALKERNTVLVGESTVTMKLT